ncbi:hypothetical protein OC834_001442 [Tilletia horrida]|nr:hypothetical protein OC834_001442 [Tilletia horrida]
MTNPLGFVFGALWSVVHGVFSTLAAVFASSTSSSAHLTAHLHASRLVLYRGPDTYLPITLLSDSPQAGSADGFKVTLVQKGYISGIFGWNLARFLGAADSGIDVTPNTSQSWDGEQQQSSSSANADADSTSLDKVSSASLTPRQRSKIHKEIETLLPSLPHKHRLGTLLVRVPVRSGDGYFRLRIASKKETVYTPTVRIFSVSLSSASVRGASLVPPTIVPELLLRTLNVAITTFLYGLFPIAALLEKVLPRKWSRKLLGWLYRRLGMEQRQRAFMDKHGQRVTQAKRTALETVPFATLGVRTSLELEKDEKVGRGGVVYLHKA